MTSSSLSPPVRFYLVLQLLVILQICKHISRRTKVQLLSVSQHVKAPPATTVSPSREFTCLQHRLPWYSRVLEGGGGV